MAGGRKARGCEAPPEDQEWYVRENAVAIVRAKNEQIERLRKELSRKDDAIRGYKGMLKKLQGDAC